MITDEFDYPEPHMDEPRREQRPVHGTGIVKAIWWTLCAMSLGYLLAEAVRWM